MTYPLTYEHKDWPRDLVNKETGARKEFKSPEGVPPGWFTVDGDEVNPVAAAHVETEAKKSGKAKKSGDTPSE